MKQIRIIHTLTIALVIAAVLTGCATQSTLQKSDELDHLVSDMGDQAEMLFTGRDSSDFFYSDLKSLPVDSASFPASFDLRDKGLVTPVKDQGDLGTCWAFSIMAASESSILSSLGMTTDSYRETYQEDMGLSARHLTWFSGTALPALDDYPEGEYPYDASQAGEGSYPLEGNNPFSIGGTSLVAIASLSSEIGILKDKYAPYTDNEGNVDYTGDWSLPEEDRFFFSYELKDISFLPSFVQETPDGGIIYRQGMIEAVKKELMAGHAVSVGICADPTLPDEFNDKRREMLTESLKNDKHLSEERLAYYIDARCGFVDLDTISIEELRQLVLDRTLLNDLPEDTYDIYSFDRDQLILVFMSAYFGEPYDRIVEYSKKEPYLSFIGTDPLIYAQYTYERKPADHEVTIVGWDDSFSAENWPESRRPPADGAWIARNSWGEVWGDGGYFLLSYYDLALCEFAIYDYILDSDEAGYDYVIFEGHDYMRSQFYAPSLFDEPVYAANILRIEEDGVLNSVSVLTGDMDTDVTVEVYLLDEGATEPTQGTLLLTAEETLRYAGYHRIPVGKISVKEGSYVGVVIKETLHKEDGIKYAFICSGDFNEKGSAAFNEMHEDDVLFCGYYSKGIINRGESFIRFESGNWMDWYDVIRYVKRQRKGKYKYMEYDNIPIKIYLYPAD